MQLIALCAVLAAAPGPVKSALDFDSLLGGLSSLVTPPSPPEVTVTSGVVVRHVRVVSNDKPEALAIYFARRFAEAGLFFPKQLKSIPVESGKVVSGFDTENLITHTVILQPNAKGTTIILAEGDMSHVDIPKTSEAIAPVYADGKDVVTAQLEGLKWMSYTTRATPAQLKDFYRAEMPKLGYQVQSPDEGLYPNPKTGNAFQVQIRPGVSMRYVSVTLMPAAASPH